MYLPPNGDGNNDLFYVLSQSGVRVITFRIFNRTGEKVYDQLSPWDGNYKGKPAPPGVYVYYVELGLFGDDRAITRKGSVTMIR
jgi:gliding motility-associated-like protein